MPRVYPNGTADVNQFQAAGGPGFVIRELLRGGLMHADVLTVNEGGLAEQTHQPVVVHGQLAWQEQPTVSADETVLRTVDRPFSPTGGLRLLTGNLGRAVIKVSAVPEDRWIIEAPARVLDSQGALQAAFAANELQGDFVAVVRFQGPRSNGMPELHKLTPTLAVLQGRGQRVALVTDGRMSGASGKVPAAIHLVPEAADGGPLARVRNGDLIRLDAVTGTLQILASPDFDARTPDVLPDSTVRANARGVGRGLFVAMRRNVTSAEEGACTWL